MQDQKLLIEMERVILSDILFVPDRYDDIAETLSYMDFSLHIHACMFRAFGLLRDNNDAITPELVCAKMQELQDNITIDDVTTITRELPVAGIDEYIKKIKNESMKRQILGISSYMREGCQKNDTDYMDILQESERLLYALSTDKLQSDFKMLKEVAISTIKMIEENKTLLGEVRGVNTGFTELNSSTTGFNPGELIVIGARPSMGKTALVLSMALRAISANKGVALFSLEMPAEQLMLRMLSARSMVPLQAMRSGQVDDSQVTLIGKAIDSIVEHNNFYVDDNPHLTIGSLRSKLRKLKSKDPTLSIVFIDYLQIMSDVKGAKDSIRHEFIAEVSRSLKLLARELAVPIVALSQLNRALDSRDDKRPILSDLRESGAIEQDADIILFLYRDEVYKERESKNRIAKARSLRKKGENVELEELYKAPEVEDVEIILAKNRNGETRTITIEFNKKFTLFQDKQDYRDMQRYLSSHQPLFNASPSIDISGMPRY